MHNYSCKLKKGLDLNDSQVHVAIHQPPIETILDLHIPASHMNLHDIPRSECD